MDVQAVMAQLAQWGNESRRKYNAKRGAGENQFGVTMSNLRSYAKKIGIDHEIAVALWNTGNIDAMILASMLFDPVKLSKEDVIQMAGSFDYLVTVDEFIFNAVAETPIAPELRTMWMPSEEDYLGRAGWALAIDHILSKKVSDAELTDYIAQIEAGMKDAPPSKQDAMNRALCEIGIRYPQYTERCVTIGERMGIYRDEKVSKGCVGRYAPDWIAAGIKKRA